MRMWKTLAMALTGVVTAGLLAACGTASPTATPTQAAAAEEAAPAPVPVIVPAPVVEAPTAPVAAPASTTTIDGGRLGGKPLYGGIFDLWGTTAGTFMDPYALTGGVSGLNHYNSLIQVKYPYDPAKGVEYEPTLATEWSQSADGSKWTLKLRQGVTWHDGEAFNADDVVATTRRVLDKDFLTALAFIPLRDIFVNVKKIDNYTVEFDTGVAKATAFTYLSNYVFVMTPEHLITGSDPGSTDVNKRWKLMGLKPGESGTLGIGTGPFKITDWKAESHLIGERNPNYFRFDEQGNRLPYMDKVRTTVVLDQGRRVANFQVGQFDFGEGLGNGMTLRDATATCKQTREPDCYLIRWPHGFGTITSNHQSTPIFLDPKVNTAARYGHDIGSVVNNAYAGGDSYLWVARSGFPDATLTVAEQYALLPWSDPARKAEYFQKAKGLLAEAGYPDGVALPLPFYGASGGGTSALCRGSFLDQYTRHADQINRIGFKASLECREGVAYAADLLAGRWSMVGVYPSINIIDPGGALIQNGIRVSALVGGQPFQWPGVDETDARFHQIQKTVDPVKRNEQYKEIERFLANPSLTQWPTFYAKVYMAVHGCVHNYLPGLVYPSKSWGLERVWLSEEGKCRN